MNDEDRKIEKGDDSDLEKCVWEKRMQVFDVYYHGITVVEAF